VDSSALDFPDLAPLQHGRGSGAHVEAVPRARRYLDAPQMGLGAYPVDDNSRRGTARTPP
jgi:hypothetical protein